MSFFACGCCFGITEAFGTNLILTAQQDHSQAGVCRWWSLSPPLPPSISRCSFPLPHPIRFFAMLLVCHFFFSRHRRKHKHRHRQFAAEMEVPCHWHQHNDVDESGVEGKIRQRRLVIATPIPHNTDMERERERKGERERERS